MSNPVKVEMKITVSCQDYPYQAWEVRGVMDLPEDIEWCVRDPKGRAATVVNLGSLAHDLLVRAARMRRAFWKGRRLGRVI